MSQGSIVRQKPTIRQHTCRTNVGTSVDLVRCTDDRLPCNVNQVTKMQLTAIKSVFKGGEGRSNRTISLVSVFYSLVALLFSSRPFLVHARQVLLHSFSFPFPLASRFSFCYFLSTLASFEQGYRTITIKFLFPFIYCFVGWFVPFFFFFFD